MWGKTKHEAGIRPLRKRACLGWDWKPMPSPKRWQVFMDRFLAFIKPNDDNEYGVSPSVPQEYRYHSTKHILPPFGIETGSRTH